MKKEPNITPDFLFHIAQGFYDTGYSLAKSIEKDKSVKGFQRLAPAVVNFSFAVELLLKGLLSLTIKLNLQGHQFWQLYKNLPASVKSLIETKYNIDKQKLDKELGNYKIRVYPAKTEENPYNPESKINEESTIKDLLMLHNNSFDNWRYLYEVKDAGFEYEYDFKLMNCFVKSLVEVINEIKSKRPPTFVITKPDLATSKTD